MFKYNPHPQGFNPQMIMLSCATKQTRITMPKSKKSPPDCPISRQPIRHGIRLNDDPNFYEISSLARHFQSPHLSVLSPITRQPWLKILELKHYRPVKTTVGNYNAEEYLVGIRKNLENAQLLAQQNAREAKFLYRHRYRISASLLLLFATSMFESTLSRHSIQDNLTHILGFFSISLMFTNLYHQQGELNRQGFFSGHSLPTGVFGGGNRDEIDVDPELYFSDQSRPSYF